MDKIKTLKDASLPLVVLFGRANVGKSTLFNCLIGKKQALVSDIPGTTRDSNIGEVQWQGREFTLIDTGGILELKDLKEGKSVDKNEISRLAQRQAVNYLKEADLVIFLTDNKSGLTAQDKELALFIKKNTDAKKIIVAANKVDSPLDRLKTSEFYKLALGEPCPVSAANGSGTGDLLDVVVKKLGQPPSPLALDDSAKNPEISPDTNHLLRVCVIGKPNVGKSSLLNSLLGYERVIVSPIPHTTREPQHTKIIYENQPLLLIDTAGISKKGDKTSGLEKHGIAKSLSALAKSDLALLVLDISEPLTRQDARLAEEIVNNRKSFILIANKWDKALKRDTKKYTYYIYNELPFARYAPIQFISAKTGEKVKKILDLTLKINRERKIELPREELMDFLKRVVKTHLPSRGKGVHHPRIRDFYQLESNPPLFEIKIGPKEDLHFSYIRFLENRLRESYGFLGTPLNIQVAKSRGAHGLHKE